MEKQNTADLEAARRDLAASQDLATMLEEELSTVRQGVVVNTPAGPLSTTNPEAIETYVNGLLERAEQLEARIEAVRIEKEGELEAIRQTKNAALSQSAVLADQLGEVKEDLAKERSKAIDFEKRLDNKEQECTKVKEELKQLSESLAARDVEEMKKLQEELLEKEKENGILDEKVSELRRAVEKYEKLLERVRTANEKLKNNEEIYKQAITKLKTNVKEREMELEDLYKSIAMLRKGSTK